MARTKDFDESDVLNKAVCLFWHKGYHGTSMQELVDTLGISRSSLYDTYGDKHSLYIQALEFYRTSTVNQIISILTDVPSAKEAIKQLLEYIIGQVLDDTQQKGCFMVNAEVEVASHDEQVRDIICKNEQQLEEAFYLLLQKGQQEEQITRKQDARALARFLINIVKGMRVSARSTTDKRFFDDIINTTLLVLD